jgi:hypothetical protein
MKKWNSEEQIKAQLRELTDETRKLRNELDALIRPPKAPAPGGFMHDRAGSKPPPVELPRRRRRRQK